MARFDKSSQKRQGAHAPVASRGTAAKKPAQKRPPSIEDAMFFPKLRRSAKSVFVLLAVFLGGGFVIFGVGAGGVGVGDVFRNSGADGSQSISDARKKTEENPKDPGAWRDLSTAYQTDGRTGEAIVALGTASDLAPKDADILRELAGLYLASADEKQREAQNIQIDAAFAAASQNFPGTLVSKGQAVFGDPIGQSVNAIASERANTALALARAEANSAVETYKKIAALSPDDPNVQLELASTAQQIGDNATAIAAYERFLKLAPDDSNATLVRSELKRLKAAQ